MYSTRPIPVSQEEMAVTIRRLIDEVKALQADAADLRRENSALTTEVCALTLERDKARSNLGELVQEYEALQRRYYQVEIQRNDLLDARKAWRL